MSLITFRRRSQSRGPTAVVASGLVVVAVVVIATVDPFGWREPPSLTEAIASAGRDVPLAPVTVVHNGDGAATPEEAVTAFLDATIAGDSVTAHGLLSLNGRSRFATPEAWANQRLNLLGQITSWRWIDDPTVTEITRVATVSPVHGIQPPTATITWSTVDEDGWRVDLDTSTLEPVLPTDAAAVEAARRWLDSCGDPAAAAENQKNNEGVLGPDPDALSRACGRTITPGMSAEPAIGRAAADLMVTYGPTAPELTRAIPIGDPVEVLIIMAPDIDGEWILIDVVEP